MGAAVAAQRGSAGAQAYQLNQLQAMQMRQGQDQHYVDLDEGMHMDGEYVDIADYYDEEIEGSGDSSGDN